MGPRLRIGDMLTVYNELAGSPPWNFRSGADAERRQTAVCDAAITAMAESVSKDIRAPLADLRAVAQQQLQLVIKRREHDRRCRRHGNGGRFPGGNCRVVRPQRRMMDQLGPVVAVLTEHAEGVAICRTRSL